MACGKECFIVDPAAQDSTERGDLISVECILDAKGRADVQQEKHLNPSAEAPKEISMKPSTWGTSPSARKRIEARTLIALVFVALTTLCWADSPLTSTDIASAYSTHALVVEAEATEGVITQEICLQLNSPDVPIGVKIAAINAVGWVLGEYAGNAEKFLSVNAGSMGFSRLEDLLEYGTADQLICYAYLKAMDDYLDVSMALQIASVALERAPHSLAIAMVHGLIRGQIALDSNWCSVYQSTAQIREHRGDYNFNFSDQALEAVYAYMDRYEKYCHE